MELRAELEPACTRFAGAAVAIPVTATLFGSRSRDKNYLLQDMSSVSGVARNRCRTRFLLHSVRHVIFMSLRQSRSACAIMCAPQA